MSGPRATLLLTGLAILSGMVAACGDDPFAIRWSENRQEATIYALDRPEPGLRSAFNLFERTPVKPEDPGIDGRWDFALERAGDRLRLVPPKALGHRDSRAGIVPMPGMEWEEVEEAPADTAVYVTDEPVDLEAGTLYIVRTHEQTGRFGQRCVFYGKVEPREVNAARGTFTFIFDVSPDCNNRNLVPPTD